jgi:hypothetical protein
MIQVGESPPQTVQSLLNRYSHFTSIEETTQSHELGKYLFMTTAAKFEKGKQFITNSIPQLWAKLDNTFLDELPSSVRYPRLTTSNLKDASTTRTAALLSATAIPDDITVASRWSKPPQLNQQPPKAVIVNYTDQHFPPTTNTRPQTNQPKNNHNHSTSANGKGSLIDNSSNHSNASATSAGTTFTREDGQSLFTSLTESFMEDIKSQTEAVMQQNKTLMDMFAQQNELNKQHTAREQLYREAQEAHNAKTDDKFAQMMTAFIQQGINNRPSTSPSPPTVKKPKPIRTCPIATVNNHYNNTQLPTQMELEEDTARGPVSPPLPMDITTQQRNLLAQPLSALNEQRFNEYHQEDTSDEGSQKYPFSPEEEYSNNQEAEDAYERGTGTDDDNEWQMNDEGQTQESKSVDTVLADEAEAQSVTTIDSTTRNHTQPQRDQKQHSMTPTEATMDQTNTQKTPRRPRSKSGLHEIEASRQHMIKDIQAATKTENDNLVAHLATAKSHATIKQRHSPHPPSPLRLANNPFDWKIVNSTKRKAKDSPPSKDDPLNIRKPSAPRSTKKTILSARDSKIEAAGQIK